MKLKIISADLIAVVFFLLIVHCWSPIAGNGSQTPNGQIVAMVYNPSGTPAANAKVRFYHLNNDPRPEFSAGVVDSTKTDANGNYIVTIDTGTYTIEASGDSGLAFQDSVTAIKDDTVRPHPDTLMPAGSIRGVVQLQSGDDPKTIFVLFIGTNTWTNLDDTCGNFTVDNVAGGKRRVRISPRGPIYLVTDTNLTVTPGKVDSVNLQINLNPNPVTIMTSMSALQSFIGMTQSKLVYVNVTGSNRTLCRVDFCQTFPYVAEYCTDRRVYMPMISPDGRYVAYCNKNEGQSGPSKISIRSIDSLNSPIVQLATDSAYIPRWWVNPATGDTMLVYTNSAIDNANALWPLSKTYVQKMSGGLPNGAPQELISNGSFHDGLSASGQFAVTGYTRLMRRDLVAGVDTQLYLSPENGKDLMGSTQVCNITMSPDTGSGARCMLLDFGYPRVSTIIGTSYGVHEYLFVLNMSGTVTDYMKCPTGDQSWDGVEWTNQAQFGVGVGRNGSGQAHAVYAIDLTSKNTLLITTGTELQQPCLWIGNF
jgi:hypothetical protein